MGASRSLQRLLRIREVEEEQRRLSLETAQAQLRSLQQASETARQMQKQGRTRVVEGMISGVIVDRQAGLVEAAAGEKRAGLLEARIAAAENETLERRQAFLEKRVERRQAQTLMDEAETRSAMESGRRSQREVDDWYGTRNHGKAGDEG